MTERIPTIAECWQKFVEDSGPRNPDGSEMTPRDREVLKLVFYCGFVRGRLIAEQCAKLDEPQRAAERRSMAAELSCLAHLTKIAGSIPK